MEGGLPGWDGPCERQGLSIRTVYWVRFRFYSCATSLLTPRHDSEFDW
jgi:hypothetical protein